MSVTNAPYRDYDDTNLIDLVEDFADSQDWQFDRVSDDQIAVAAEGLWRSYSLTLAWSPFDETLRLICTFEFESPTEKVGELYDLINRINDVSWGGSFTWWGEQKLIVWRYGLFLTETQIASPAQVDAMISTALRTCDRFYPAFHLLAFTDTSASEALQAAIAESYGRA